MQWMLLAFCVRSICSTSATGIQCSSIVTEAHPPPSNRHHNFENTFAIVISASSKGFLPHPAMQTFEQSLHYTLKIGLPACTRKHYNWSTNGVKLVAKERKMPKCPAIPLFLPISRWTLRNMDRFLFLAGNIP